MGRRIAFAWFWPLVVLSWPLLLAAQDERTGLDDYALTQDPAYTWQEMGNYPGLGYASYVVQMTSQSWRDRGEVDQTFWTHWIRVAVPTVVRYDTAVLLINGGDNNDGNPGAVDLAVGLAAAAAGVVVAELRLVPNQPLRFTDEARARSEDAIIAYSWDKYLRTGDEEWPAQLPMTKAAVWAMTAVTDFASQPEYGGHLIKDFIVTGGSKRGWTSWLTAAVDPRVKAVAPIVFDALNLESSLQHHWQAYGFWAPAISDYKEMGIFAWRGSRQMRSLLELVDPYEYRGRLDMPKFILNASGDEFFVPTSSQFYLDDLPGHTRLRYVPNSPHSVDTADALASVLAWGMLILDEQPVPAIDWESPEQGRVAVTTDTPAADVRLWQATNPAARDFRVDTIGEAWTDTPLVDQGGGRYEAAVAAPPAGWTAYFVEATFNTGGLFPLQLTTPVQVTPDTLPFPPPLATILSASGSPYTTPDSIVSTFSDRMADGLHQATGLPLPTELGGISVRVTDSLGAQRLAGLFFTSRAQINYRMPPGVALGLAHVEVLRAGVPVTSGDVLVEAVSPGIYSANADGQGVVSAVVQYFYNDGSNSWTLSFTDAPLGSREAKEVHLQNANGDVYLSLFGTGMAGAAEAAVCHVGGVPVPCVGPVPSPEFLGLQQINVGPLPRSLGNFGEAAIEIEISGLQSNITTVLLR